MLIIMEVSYLKFKKIFMKWVKENHSSKDKFKYTKIN